MKPIRCAIYTRKSTEEGLDQAFNSLHAQREACEAYIKSQAAEGWKLIPTVYDDGGFSGGNMERPALKQLLADVDAGRIDTIVVYKIDRLTRALSDFARIVERLDRADASFVSVTQAFNTTTSMGRLTLNVLLSFAQFEREVTGERIRDKIAASKKKGMWMGGVPPIGYGLPTDKATRALTLDPVEAPRVRRIFELYLELGSVAALEARLEANGWRTRERISAKGVKSGGVAFSRGSLFHTLKNRIYLGEIAHGEGAVAGAHPAIIDPEVFDRVQAQIRANAVTHSDRPLRSSDLPLKGLLRDADGHPMSPSFGYGRGGKVYRYYVSAPLQQGRANRVDRNAIRRVKAEAIHELVEGGLRSVFCGGESSLQALIMPLARIDVLEQSVRLTLKSDQLSAGVRSKLQVDPHDPTQMLLDLPVRCQVRGGRVDLVAPAGGALPQKFRPDPVLIRGLRQAHRLAKGLGWNSGKATFDALDAQVPKSAYERNLVRLAFLAPDIQSRILEGLQPPTLSLAQLMSGPIPTCWIEQRQRFC